MFFTRERKKATKASWDNKPLSEKRISLPYDRKFSLEEYKLISYGFIPDSMEDKWFIYLENDVVYFHRSWTGICIFQLHLENVHNFYQVKETYFASNNELPDDNVSQEKLFKENIHLLNGLIDVFLLLKR